MRQSSTILPTLMLFDSQAMDRGHLIADDRFLAECLQPLAQDFAVVTSTASAANIAASLPVQVRAFRPFTWCLSFARLRLILINLTLSCSRFEDIVFQSFDEVATLIFMLVHPRTRVHVIVTNNLRPVRMKRHPFLGPLLLKAVLRRATSVFVHSEFARGRVQAICKDIDPERVFIKPFHQIAFTRRIRPFPEKKNTVLFLGPEMGHKSIAPVVELIKRDRDRRFHYVLCSMGEIDSRTETFLKEQANVELEFGYLADEEYYRLFSEATYVIMTHDAYYEGALSGAVCDAFASGTALISRNMAPQNEFFDRFGEMGFLVDFDNPGWCDQVLNADLKTLYPIFQDHMAACRESCSMENIREVFRSALAP